MRKKLINAKNVGKELGYRLDYSERKCMPYFANCRGTKFIDCMECESKINNDTSISSRCTRCYDHYMLVNGNCEYDFNYQKSNIKVNILLLIIILLL